MAKYTFQYLAEHGDFGHIDVRILKDDVEYDVRRIALGDNPFTKEEGLEFLTIFLESLKTQVGSSQITKLQAKNTLEAFELWR